MASSAPTAAAARSLGAARAHREDVRERPVPPAQRPRLGRTGAGCRDARGRGRLGLLDGGQTCRGFCPPAWDTLSGGAGPGWAPATCKAGPPHPRTKQGTRRLPCVSDVTSAPCDTRSCTSPWADVSVRQATGSVGAGRGGAGSAAGAHAEGFAPTRGSLCHRPGGPRSSPPWPGSLAEPRAARDPRPRTRDESLDGRGSSVEPSREKRPEAAGAGQRPQQRDEGRTHRPWGETQAP